MIKNDNWIRNSDIPTFRFTVPFIKGEGNQWTDGKVYKRKCVVCHLNFD